MQKDESFPFLLCLFVCLSIFVCFLSRLDNVRIMNMVVLKKSSNVVLDMECIELRRKREFFSQLYSNQVRSKTCEWYKESEEYMASKSKKKNHGYKVISLRKCALLRCILVTSRLHFFSFTRYIKPPSLFNWVVPLNTSIVVLKMMDVTRSKVSLPFV